MPAKNYASTRFSGMEEITTANVANLKVSFTFSTGVLQGHEAAPLVIQNTMYIVTPYPNYLYALDLTRTGGPVKWKFEPKPVSASQGVACCDVVNRGVAYSNGRIFMNTLDGNTIAVDANTGKELWKIQLGDINKGETITMAPLVVKDKVLVGDSGGEFGVRGWLAAINASDGSLAWRAYSTGPDSEVLIGPDFKAFLCTGSRERPWDFFVAARCLENRRRHDVGLDLLRSRLESDLLRHRQSRPMESGTTSGRQQMDLRHFCSQSGYRSGALVLPVEPA
jgi:glucose dehydrogenase